MDDTGNFSSAVQFWKSVGLPALQRELDQQGLAIIENQKDGLVSRKKLAEQTREFKKIPDEEKLQKFKPLLKAYQAEIDNITRRTKYSENAFLTLYKTLADAPDPAPLFDAAVEQSANAIDHRIAKEENEKLKAELAEAKKQLEHLALVEKKNTTLEERLQALEAATEEKRLEELAQKEQEMKNQYNDKIRSYKEREHDLQRQLNQALDQLTQLRHSNDDAQEELLTHNQKYDEEVVGKLAELDIVMMDLERANSRIIELEKQNEDLKEAQTAKQGSETVADTQQDAALSKLIKDVDTYKDLLQKTEARMSKKIKELSSQVASLTDEKDNLVKKLHEYRDYDEIKRELEIMQYVEFSTGDDDRFDAQNVLKKDEKLQDSLEVKIMEKNKRLENDLTQLKVSFAQIEKEFADTKAAYDEMVSKNEAQTALIRRLEEDLLRLGQKPTGSHLVDELTRTPSSSSLALSSDPLASAEYGSPRGSYDGTAPNKDDKSILPIVMNQRDRFRQRNAELEQQTKQLGTQLQDMRSEMEALKADNLKLYERLRFIHVWKEEQEQGLTNRSTSLQMGDVRRDAKKDDPTDKYGKLYEENMNPFVQFHRKEETRRYNALNPAEKLTFNLTRILFSHRWSRYFFIVYSLSLHLLVVVTLYQLSLWECRHDHEINLPTVNDEVRGL